MLFKILLESTFFWPAIRAFLFCIFVLVTKQAKAESFQNFAEEYHLSFSEYSIYKETLSECLTENQNIITVSNSTNYGISTPGELSLIFRGLLIEVGQSLDAVLLRNREALVNYVLKNGHGDFYSDRIGRLSFNLALHRCFPDSSFKRNLYRRIIALTDLIGKVPGVFSVIYLALTAPEMMSSLISIKIVGYLQKILFFLSLLPTSDAISVSKSESSDTKNDAKNEENEKAKELKNKIEKFRNQIPTMDETSTILCTFYRNKWKELKSQIKPNISENDLRQVQKRMQNIQVNVVTDLKNFTCQLD